jgi:REP element-mobilizing transposase RayT
MSRALRPNLPGTPFHVIARLQAGEALFADLKDQVIAEIDRSTRVSGLRLLAYAVMSNHLHLVIVQGMDPLSWHMQGLMTRLARMVQRVHKRKGHVFERRYYASACTDADYFRNVIAYVHLNGVRAGICECADDYPYTSHFNYRLAALDPPARIELAAEDALRVFASTDSSDRLRCRHDYVAFMEWRAAMDKFIHAGGDPRSGAAPVRPLCEAGDRYWTHEFGFKARKAVRTAAIPGTTRPDLEKIALRALHELAPDLPLEFLRSDSRSRAIVFVRRHVIARALEIGYGPIQVARYFRLSPSTVSTIAVALRNSRIT